MVRTRRCRVELYTPPVVHPPLVHQCILEMSQNQTSELVFLAYLAMLWPWPVTFWPQNLIISCLSWDAPVPKVWRKSVNRYWRYRGNKTTTWITDGRTDRQRHGRTTRKHIASAGAYRRRRLKNLKPAKVQHCPAQNTLMKDTYDRKSTCTSSPQLRQRCQEQ